MGCLVFSIVTTFQIWTYHVMFVYRLSKSFISQDTLLNLRKVAKHELDSCTGSRVINNFSWGVEGPRWNRVKQQKTAREVSFFTGRGPLEIFQVL